MTLKLPPSDTHFKNTETYQLKQYNAGVAACTQRRVAVDVGAHVGIFTTRYARDFDSVVALEPIPHNLQQLYANTEHLDNVRVIPRGASSEHTELYAHNPTHNNENTGAWELSNNPSDIEVEIITIDSLNLLDVDLIKVDTQGLEQEVLEGASDTVMTFKPVIHVETQDPELLKWIAQRFNYTRHTQVNKDHILISKTRTHYE